jgi:hypothetical protein
VSVDDGGLRQDADLDSARFRAGSLFKFVSPNIDLALPSAMSVPASDHAELEKCKKLFAAAEEEILRLRYRECEVMEGVWGREGDRAGLR